MARVFTNGPEDRGSVAGRVIPKTQKWFLIAAQHFKVLMGEVEQSRERSSPLPYILV